MEKLIGGITRQNSGYPSRGEYKIVTRRGHEGLFWDASVILFLDLSTSYRDGIT